MELEFFLEHLNLAHGLIKFTASFGKRELYYLFILTKMDKMNL